MLKKIKQIFNSILIPKNLFRNCSALNHVHQEVALEPQSALNHVHQEVDAYCRKRWNQWRAN
jgi:hypothetical protein